MFQSINPPKTTRNEMRDRSSFVTPETFLLQKGQYAPIINKNDARDNQSAVNSAIPGARTHRNISQDSGKIPSQTIHERESMKQL